MPLTQAQIDQRAKRKQQMETPIADMPTEEDAFAVKATLAIMLGQGESFQVGPHEYRIAPFVTDALNEGFRLLQQTPAIITALAIAGEDGEPIKGEIFAAEFNRIAGRVPLSTDPNTRVLSPAEAVHAYQSFVEYVSYDEQAQEKMFAAIVFNLKRNHPTVESKDLRPYLDITGIVAAHRAIYRQNQGVLTDF